ncbi:MAG: hypothetical protein JST86_00165 [Bacteroidetes bacterium]|nr:hypothetical protein [Bacteroidota bacterium]
MKSTININTLIVTILAIITCTNKIAAQVTITQPPAVESYTVRKEGVTDASTVPNLTNAEKTRTISYMDGFGRPLEAIAVATSPNGKDMISFHKYDEFGREIRSYLPYEATTSTGAYVDIATAQTNQLNFYSTSVAVANKVAADNSPFSDVSYEASPLQRVINIGGVGDGNQLTQHYKTTSYRNGTAAEGIRKWVWSGSSASSTATYGDNDLVVTEVVDENNVHGSVYKDKFGRVILKRQDAPSSGNYDTYYIYDNVGNVVCIIPPKAIAKMVLAFTYNLTIAPELIYQFWYDSKNRVIQKKVPGAKEVYLIYDPLDRVVLTQDGNMRSSGGTKWAYVKYDNANRVVVEGMYTHSSVLTQSQMQSYVNGLISTYYQTGSTTYFEVKQSGSSSGYSNQCFPVSGTEERAYSYYDNYDFNADGTPDYSKLNQGLTNEATATDLTFGLLTGSKKKILGSGTPGTWITQVSFYDKYYHVIQVRSSNQIDNAVNDHTTNVVNYTGMATEARQYKSLGSTTITVGTKYEYDDMGRLVKVKQTNPTGGEVTVAKYEYNSLGQLVDKKLHSTNGVNYLQSVDMRYNIHGQLTSINNSARTNDGGVTNDESNDVFGMEILYDKVDASLGNTASYTGMITGVKWTAQTPVNSSPDERRFRYTYDNVNRLSTAVYQSKANSNGAITTGGFNESFTYDENGNIKTLQRYAILSGTTSTLIDDLTYTYGTSAADKDNQLANISDGVSNNSVGYGFRNFASSSSGYTYDDNGNLKTDAKKGTTITYNELNKPTQIINSSGQYITYRYDASGNRISKFVYINSSTTKTIEYVGGYVVENNSLSYYSMAEGRVVPGPGPGSSTIYTLEYFITDHQGNTRVSFKDDGTNTNTPTVVQENSYYAFGMVMAGGYTSSLPNKKLYNAGSELQDDIDGLSDYYSTFYREYDAVIGRFNGVDPMSENFESWTTYHYSYDNPVNYNDPNGDMSVAEFQNAVDALIRNGGGTYHSSTREFEFGESKALFYTVENLLGIFFTNGDGGTDDKMQKKVSDLWTQILLGYNYPQSNKDYKFKNISYTGAGSYAEDLLEIRSNPIGAFFLAMIEAYDVKVKVNDLILPYVKQHEGGVTTFGDVNGETTWNNWNSKDYIQINYFNRKANIQKDVAWSILQGGELHTRDGYVNEDILLFHEFAHALDLISDKTGYRNYLWAIDHSDPQYSNTTLSKTLGGPDADEHRAYFELRTVYFENLFRSSSTHKYPIRKTYSGVELGPYYIGMHQQWMNQPSKIINAAPY